MKINKNKGSVLLTFLIIILVVAVGGSAYYFGTKKTEVPVITDVEKLDDADSEINEDNINELPTPTPTPTPTPIPTPNPTPVPQTGCLALTSPWVKVLSPNGGQTYTAGQQITVTWKSCNLPSVGSSNKIDISLKKENANNVAYSLETTDDGTQTITLPTTSSGTNFKIRVGLNAPPTYVYNPGLDIYDFSDNFFTINIPQSSFLYSNGESIPNSFFIPWRTAEADFAAPVNNSDAYVCKSNNLNAQVVVLVDTPATSSDCSSVGLGCGGSYKRVAIVCGNKYMIHDMSSSGFHYWGYFDM